MLDRMTDAIDFHGKALQLRAQRQEVLSSNIANADTPGFKARDFDFAAALKSAAGGSANGAAKGAANGSGNAAAIGVDNRPVNGSAIGANANAPMARLQYTTPEQASLDGNSVDLNRERAAFADNSLRYEATLRFINSRVRTMMTAIRGE